MPDFKFDLPETMEFIKRVKLQRLNFVELKLVGAGHTTQIPAWVISSLSSKSMFPLPLDAQTGKIIPWDRAFNPPPWTDAQMKAAWDRVLHRNQQQPTNHGGAWYSAWECFQLIQDGAPSCD